MAQLAGLPLLEREAELAALERLADVASTGTGMLVYVEGEPGIGKTRLLHAAAQLATETGFEVLKARGAKLERPYAFGVTRQLFEPALRRSDPDRRRAVVAGAARFAAELIDGEPRTAHGPGSSPASIFPQVHALYWLCANLAEQTPLALIVDDAHWADEPSLQWLAYLQRRLDELPVLVIAGARPAGEERSATLEELFRAAGQTRLIPRPLSAPAALSALRLLFDRDVAAEFAHACHQVSAGNPFLLVELARALIADEIPPDAQHANDVRRARPEAVARSVLARLATHDQPAVALAQAVAVLGDDVELRLAAAIADIDPAVAGDAADALATSSILRPGRPLSFTHPLVRSAVYDELPAARRARAHRHAAQLLAADAAPPQQIAAHLLHTEPAGDPKAVRALRSAAAGARAHGSLDTAIAYLERALREPPPAQERGGLLLELGSAERQARGAGLEHLRDALTLAEGRVERVAAARELATALVGAGRGAEAWDVLDATIAEIGDTDRETALRLEGELLGIGHTVIALAPRVHARAENLPHFNGSTPGERILLASLAYLRMMSGGTAGEATALARAALRGGQLLREQTADSPPFAWALVALNAAEEHALFDALIEDAFEDVHRRGSVLGLAILSLVQILSLLDRGRVADAEATGRIGLEAGLNAGWKAGVPALLAYLVRALIERDKSDEAQVLIERLGFAGPLPELTLFTQLLYARGILRLARSEHDAGRADLIETGRQEDAAGVFRPTVMWRASLAPVLAAAGQLGEAQRLARQELDIARHRGTVRPLGVALRTLALLSDEPDRTTLLHDAVATLEHSSARLEHARALTDLGAALRRANRRSEAREPLRLALDEAHRCGADALVARAQQELTATGARPRRLVLTGMESLTASEKRIAKMAARGMSNPDIAQALFITRKTVEKHLGSAYMKLDIQARDQLAERLEKD